MWCNGKYITVVMDNLFLASSYNHSSCKFGSRVDVKKQFLYPNELSKPQCTNVGSAINLVRKLLRNCLICHCSFLYLEKSCLSNSIFEYLL